jgi:hypothetical protein
MRPIPLNSYTSLPGISSLASSLAGGIRKIAQFHLPDSNSVEHDITRDSAKTWVFCDGFNLLFVDGGEN